MCPEQMDGQIFLTEEPCAFPDMNGRRGMEQETDGGSHLGKGEDRQESVLQCIRPGHRPAVWVGVCCPLMDIGRLVFAL